MSPSPYPTKIASVLTSVDEVIENTRNKSTNSKTKKATMNELLTKGIGHTEFKDSELGRILRDWDMPTTYKLTEGRFGIVDGLFGSNWKTEHYRSSGDTLFKWIRHNRRVPC